MSSKRDFLVKICGIRRPETAIVAAREGVDLIGLVFAEASPRVIAPGEAAAVVARLKSACAAEGLKVPDIVGLVVDPEEALLAQIAGVVDALQFHGAETPTQLEMVKARFGKPAFKAIGVRDRADLACANEYDDFADLILLDARPPKGDPQTGGHGRTFDWAILEAYRATVPFLLAGGLSPSNVAAAITAASGHTAFAGVDVSSGVERTKGEKDDDLVAQFARAGRSAYEAATASAKTGEA